ncbi:mitochondrial intermembrane space import and assembly protein 40 homolog [Apium graveolens]|uniref:mitochondrial intermembrane space import and assembly protein 40 homolog n=1 Tax=Apium graveolens TaxID=4045 RepID=UPI003D79D995
MGQVQSQGSERSMEEASAAKPTQESSSPPSMESLMAEAAAFGNEDENASLDAKAQKALECPCLDDLRKGPCGSQFSGAFLCFLKSTAEEKGSDCVHPFVALQNCIKANPGAFSKDILEDEEVAKDEKPPQQYKVIPPVWSVEKKQKPIPKL